jgi:hypothetical protein
MKICDPSKNPREHSRSGVTSRKLFSAGNGAAQLCAPSRHGAFAALAALTQLRPK